MKIFILVAIFTSLAFSQTIMIPTSMGTAGTIATQARGDEVIGFNPANLGFEDNPEFSMSFGLIPIVPIPSIRVVNNAVSIDWLAKYLYSGQYLNTDKKEAMLEAFSDDGWEMNPLAYAKILGISSGDFAFSIGAELNSDIVLPTSLLRLLLFGNEFEKEISLDKVDGSAQAVIPFSLSYGFPFKLPDIGMDIDNYLGFGIKLLWGIGHGEVVEFDGGLTSYNDRVIGTGAGKYKYSFDGFGLAFDLGYALKIGDNITTNIAIQNLFGYIKWTDKNTEISEINFDANIEASDNFEDIADAFTGTDTTYSVKGYTSDYPTYLVFGAEYDVLPSINLYFNYRQYFNEEYQFSTTPRFSFATQLEPASWFPIRMGVAVGGFEKFQASVGFGLHSSHYHFDIGITQTGGFFNSARGIGFAIGQKILF